MYKIINCILTIVLFLLISCRKEDNSDFIECNTEILRDSIYKSSLNRGTLAFRGKISYSLYGSCSLIYNDTFPDWIQDYSKPDYSFNEYVFRPKISDIDVPYLLFKKKNECYFYVVKNNDTLKFKLTNHP